VRGVNHALGFVFQQAAVFPWLRVEGNIEYGPKSRGLPKAERQKLVGQWAAAVGATAFKKAYPKQLSGGMRKRVDRARVRQFAGRAPDG
jgi:NitT/TauT family transport system ATP-binding protein